jgi:hypothetical protein
MPTAIRLASLLMAHTAVSAKTKVVTLKMTPEQYRNVDQRAQQCGVKISVWMRSILLQAADRHQTSEGYLRIKEPNGKTI